MTHTPGPWRLDGDAHSMNLDVVSSEGRIAMMDCDNFKLPDSELAANANLIKAAPDMLEALERAYQKLGFWMDDDKWDDSDEDAMVQIWAAISKAKAQP